MNSREENTKTEEKEVYIVSLCGKSIKNDFTTANVFTVFFFYCIPYWNKLNVDIPSIYLREVIWKQTAIYLNRQ